MQSPRLQKHPEPLSAADYATIKGVQGWNHRRSRDTPDSPGWLTALRYDIDPDGGGAAWIEADRSASNLVVINPSNGHAHLIYSVGAWVQSYSGDSTSAQGRSLCGRSCRTRLTV
jgi:hypothetical protein